MVLGAVGGAYASSKMSGTFGTVEGSSVAESLAGGFLLMFGARLASGCTRWESHCYPIQWSPSYKTLGNLRKKGRINEKILKQGFFLTPLNHFHPIL